MVPKKEVFTPHALLSVEIEIFYFTRRCILGQVITSKKLEISTTTPSVTYGPIKVWKVRDLHRKASKRWKMGGFTPPVGVFRYVWFPRKS